MNAAQKVAAVLARQLMKAVSKHMDGVEGATRYGGMKLPTLYGSESLSEDFERAVPNYYHTLIVTVDFSGE